MENLYSSLRWRTVRARAISRDGSRCTVSRLLGGECSHGPLHAHHVVPVADGGDPFDLENVGTTCSAHHPMWEALRRQMVAKLLAEAPRCNHHHPYPGGREECERRLARRRGLVAA